MVSLLQSYIYSPKIQRMDGQNERGFVRILVCLADKFQGSNKLQGSISLYSKMC